ncbi:MAG: PAS domain S-box protein [Candidatus Thorarchaeota archaeon]|nr:PAS domain S-box protein [Candidatus Thorarchaeota archaeon]
MPPGNEDCSEKIIDEKHYRDFITHLPEGFCITDLEMNLQFVNDEFANMLGYDPKELIGKNYREIIIESEIDILLTENAKRKVGVSSVYNLKMIRKDHGVIVVKISGVPRRDEQDNVIGTMAIVFDVTVEKERELELLKLSGAIEASPTSVVITDTEGTIEYVNPKFSDLTGYSIEEAIGKNPRLLKSGRTSPEVYEELWATIKSGKIWRGRFINRKKDGTIYWEDAWISPIHTQEGKITHFVAVKEDITKNVVAEERIRRSNQDLELYASFLSHDMRNDLQILMNHAEAALMILDKESQASEYVEIVQATSERMVSLLDVFGKPADADEMDIIKIIEDAKSRAVKAHSGMRVTINSYIKDTQILGARLIPLVFDNLFRNAAEFSDKAVLITINVSRIDDMIRIEVHDNGPGIPDEIRPKLFNKGASTTGGGYGLYLSKKVIEGYGGTIGLMQREGMKGASFEIKLPAKD